MFAHKTLRLPWSQGLVRRAVLAGCLMASAHGQSRTDALTPDLAWFEVDEFPAEVLDRPGWIRPAMGRRLTLDSRALEATLLTAPQEDGTPVRESRAVIVLPRPDGGTERFAFVESSLMHPDLQARYPEIRSYLGQGIDDASATIRFGMGPRGFHAMVLRGATRTVQESAWYIDPVSRGDDAHYTSYWHGALRGERAWTCEVEPAVRPLPQAPRGPHGPIPVLRNEFFIAIATTGEYTQWVCAPNPPSVPVALDAVNQTLNRVNLILERDGPVRLHLANNNDLVIYTDPSTDPYSGGIDALLSQNDSNLDAVLGEDNYGLGHLFHQASLGGKAGLACVCQDNRGRGVSTRSQPTGDFFDIDLVAHEIGHQLGAQHTFNSDVGTCGPNRNASTAYEPGEGNTIMSYAGGCGAASPSWPNSAAIPMYSFISMLEIAPVVVGAECVARFDTGNRHTGATPDPLGPYVIPTQTPFRLMAPSAELLETGDVITYSIEQADLGGPGPFGPDLGVHAPLMRVRPPLEYGERWFPAYENVINGTASANEVLPLFSRSSVFKGVLRDNVAGGGGWGMSDIYVQFVSVPDPGFVVTAPVGGELRCGGEAIVVTWNVAGTNEAPFDAATVDVLLSTDNGENFPWTLAADFPNVGAALVPLPYVPTSQARVMVRAGLFYNVNALPFEIATGVPTITAQPSGVETCPGMPFALTVGTGGGSPQHIQWFRDGAPLEGETEATFQVSHADHWQTGDYHVVVSNGCGAVVSQTVRVQIGVTFNAEPQNQTPQPCETVALGVDARGVGALSYQWYKDGEPIVDAGHVTGGLTPTLVLDGVRYEDEGLYFCRVTDQCETRTAGPAAITLPTPTWVDRTRPGPPSRQAYNTDMAYDPVRGVAVLYGGWSPSAGYLDDTWEWDGVSWTQRFPAHDPGRRLGHEMVFDSTRNTILLFGGWSTTANHNAEVWEYDGNDWTLITTSPGGPSPVSSQQGDATYDAARGKMIVLMELADGPTPTNRTWEFDSLTETWEETYAGTGPTPYDAPLAFDPERGYVLAQEYSYTGIWEGTFKYTPGNWGLANPVTPERYWPVMAYDTVRARPTIYGCCRNIGSPSAYRTDTYTYDGSAWSLLLPEFHPTQYDAVVPAAMVFDSQRRAMVMIGNTYNDYGGANPLDTLEYRYLDRIHLDRQPVDRVAPLDGTAEFEVIAAGAGAPEYQWYHRGAPLADGPGPHGSIIAGATTSLLTISGIGAGNAGAYHVEVWNACGSIASTPASLLITGVSGDLDGDALVDLEDVMMMQIVFGACAGQAGFLAAADLDGDGCIEMDDALLFFAEIGM